MDASPGLAGVPGSGLGSRRQGELSCLEAAVSLCTPAPGSCLLVDGLQSQNPGRDNVSLPLQQSAPGPGSKIGAGPSSQQLPGAGDNVQDLALILQPRLGAAWCGAKRHCPCLSSAIRTSPKSSHLLGAGDNVQAPVLISKLGREAACCRGKGTLSLSGLHDWSQPQLQAAAGDKGQCPTWEAGSWLWEERVLPALAAWADQKLCDHALLCGSYCMVNLLPVFTGSREPCSRLIYYTLAPLHVVY